MPKLCRVGPLHFTFAGRPIDVLAAAVAGATFCGIAGASLGLHNHFDAFQEDGPVAGVTIGLHWQVFGILSFVTGVAMGALVGALAALIAGSLSCARGSAAAVVAVGTLGGIMAGATWGRVLAEEREMTVRAYTLPAPAPVRGGGEGFSVTTGNLQMIGKLNRRTSVSVLALVVFAGTALGWMAGRALAGAWPAPEAWASPPEGSFPVVADEPTPPRAVTAGAAPGARPGFSD